MSDTREKRVSPVVLILGSSVISGVTGYLVTAIVAAALGPVGYATFAVYWSALFFVVGAFGGVQQEVTRASSGSVERVSRPSGARVSVFALVLAVALFVALAATGPLWTAALFPSDSLELLWPLAVGAASYVLVASLCGSLYGVRLWYPLALLIIIDGVLRLAGVLIVLTLWEQPAAIAWAVVAPFPLAVVIVLPMVAHKLGSRLHMDVGYRQLSWNVARTVLAAAATASLVSGFPVLLKLTSPGTSAAVIGPLILAFMLTRAPIVIPLLALQSYLIVHFTDRVDLLARRVLRLEVLVVASSLALAIIAAWAGPGILRVLFGDGFVIDSGMLFVLVASSGLVAALCVSGPAALARSAHGLFAAGWVAAAVATMGLLFVPFDLDARVTLALTGGPVVGLVVHLVALAGKTR